MIKIKEFIKSDDVVYCLGDCGDRGPEPWGTIKAVATDPQFIYIKGNHEDMLVKAAKEVFMFEFNPYTHHQRVLAANGGEDTLQQLLSEENPERWVNHLSNLPTHITYKNSKVKKFSYVTQDVLFGKKRNLLYLLRKNYYGIDFIILTTRACLAILL
ncbi:MAG: metallophosphoesterase [Clostridia bacterium]|nr:metallophosphoesterase [Clostridia bacterium]